ncbi:MAG TPA: cytochrome b5 domain-containing protein, partial [Candidatus Paceibacterota bacterium]
TVTGPGINCGADCREYIAPGSSLSLDQTPQSGWSFYGWSGACSGTGSCNLLMDSAKIINATFATSAPSPLSVSCSASPTSINRGDASSWGATITGGLGSYTYNWSGTDGLLGTTPSVAQVYNTVGTKSASVTVTSGAEQVTRACSNTITVGDQAALSVSCSGSPTSINTNDTANWTAAVSGGLGSYSYSWAGTDSLGGSSASVSKVYTAQGTKSADVTVASGSEQITRACGNSISVTVPTAALQASCSVNPTSASTNQNVTWTSSVSGGTGAYTYSWSGSDALSGNTSSVTRAYTSGGTKSAAVAVTSGTQQVNPTCSNSVSVTTGPPIITAQEIALHNAQSNCWWYIGTNVYNMTAYFGRHPGGNSRMLPYCGTNAEPGYNSRNHSNTADTQLASFQIGILGTVAQQNTASSLSQNMAQVFSSPAKPVRISLSAVAMSAFHANLVWKPLVEANIKEYSIIRNGELISTVDATGFVDTALSPAAGYTYKVVGLDGKGKALYESAKVTIKTKARPICGLDVLGVIPCLVEQNYPGAVLKTQNIRQNGAQLLKILWRGQCRAIGTVPDGTLVEDIKC